jgi:hypothetical protein
MNKYPIRSPLCVAVLLGAALAQAPPLVQAQSQTPGAAPAASSAPAKPAAHAAGKKVSTPPARASLDLKAPPLSHLYPREQLQYILAVDSTDADDTQEVSVKGEKYLMPVPTNQFQAIPWAVMHPTQAWRVFTPLEAP